MRVPHGALRPTRNGGFLHRLRDDPEARRSRRRGRRVRTAYARAVAPARDLGTPAAAYRTAADPTAVAALAARLGLSADALSRLGVGWAYDRGTDGLWDAGDVIRSAGRRVWSFPMRDAAGRVVGIRLRTDAGEKFAARGGREGLFLPAGLADDLSAGGGPLLVTEGPTDCAALLGLGFAAVGRPSCTGGAALLAGLLGRLRPAEVVIVADADPRGRRGAEALAAALVAYAPRLRVIAPPAGVKDARAWVLAGGTAADVRAAIAAAPARRLAVSGRILRGRHDRKEGRRHGH